MDKEEETDVCFVRRERVGVWPWLGIGHSSR